MKLYRVMAIIERNMRKFFRSPALMMTSMVFPLLQLIVLGYAFGGQIKNVRLALVDEDHGPESRLVRERLNAVADGPRTFRVSEYNDLSDAMTDLRAGFVKAVLEFPEDFSQRVLRNEKPRLAFIEDNTDNFTASGIFERIQQIQTDLNGPPMLPRNRRVAGVDTHRHVHPATPAVANSDSDDRSVSLHRVHQVSARRLDFHLDFRRGHDRRRHWVHRRQGARVA